jgi:hypothetical protein
MVRVTQNTVTRVWRGGVEGNPNILEHSHTEWGWSEKLHWTDSPLRQFTSTLIMRELERENCSPEKVEEGKL